MGSMPVDLKRGNKTFRRRRATTQFPVLHVNLSVIAHLEFPSHAFVSSPRKPISVFVNILVIYLSIGNTFGCAVFVSQRGSICS